MIVKAGLGIIGLGAISIGGVAVTKPRWLGMDSQPESTTLDQDYDYSSKTNEYNGKFGETNKSKLVGVSGKTANGNKDWWEWSFRRLQAAEIEDGKFAVKGKGSSKDNIKVTKGYANTGDDKASEALNQVCYAAYKTETGKVKTNANHSSTDEFDVTQVWEYCARPGAKDAASTQ